MHNQQLIQIAASMLKPRKVADRVFADVGAAVLSEAGDVFAGVSVDTPGWGLCAERSAIAAMITAGQYRIRKVVAVWRDSSGRLYILPPCGICREFMRAIDTGNLETEIILGGEHTAPLKRLLPMHEWPSPFVL